MAQREAAFLSYILSDNTDHGICAGKNIVALLREGWAAPLLWESNLGDRRDDTFSAFMRENSLYSARQ
jgi:hypothetical protein